MAKKKKAGKISRHVGGIIILCLIAAFGITMGCIYGMGKKHYLTHFYPGTYINGVNCGEKTVAEVKDELQDRIEDYCLTITGRNGMTDTITARELSMTYADDGDVEAILENQDVSKWMFKINKGGKDYQITTDFSYNKESLDDLMKRFNCFDETQIAAPTDAYIYDDGTTYSILPETQGNTVVYDDLKEAILEAVETGEETIDCETLGLYEEPSILSTDVTLNQEVAQMNQLCSADIVYDFVTYSYEVNRSLIQTWMYKDTDGSYKLNYDKIYSWVQEMAWETDTFGLEHEFTTSYGVTITLAAGGDFGWYMDKDATAAALQRAIETGYQGQLGAEYIYSTYDRSPNDIGDTYVEVCIEEQRMWCYVDGECIVDTPVVTGCHNTGFDTPSGSVWAIDGKKANMNFKTFTNITVAYWLPFNGDCGIHESDWRDASEYGGTTYLDSGSHGCINTPAEAAAKIFDAMDIGYPVIVYYSLDQVVGPEPTNEIKAG